MYGNNDTKLNARIEAVRLATTVKGVTLENILEVSKGIASFIIGEANIPEANDKGDYLERLMEKMIEKQGVTSKGMSENPGYPIAGDASALGIIAKPKHE